MGTDLSNLSYQISKDPNFQLFKENYINFAFEFSRQNPYEASSPMLDALFNSLSSAQSYNEVTQILTNNGFSNPSIITNYVQESQYRMSLLGSTYSSLKLTEEQIIAVVQDAWSSDNNFPVFAADCCGAYKGALRGCLYEALGWVARAWGGLFLGGVTIDSPFSATRKANNCIDNASKTYSSCCH